MSLPALCMAVAAPCAAQSVSVSYAQEVSEELREEIEKRIPDADPAKSALQAKRYARRAQTLIKDTLNSYGYYDPDLTPEITQSEGRPSATIKIDTGPLFTIDRAELNFIGSPPRGEDIAKLESGLPVKSGAPAIPAEIIDAERVVTNLLRSSGYAFAQTTQRDVIGDRDAATISVRYNVESGARVRIGEVIYPTDIRTKTKYLDRLNPTEQGELYDPNQLALYNSRLSDTRLFTTSSARLSDEPISTSPDGDAVYNIVLNAVERPRNTIALGGNFGTDEGLGVSAELTRRNLTRRGDLLVANLALAQRESGLDLIWRRPNELGYGKGLILTAAVLDKQTDAFDQQLARIGAGYEVVVGPEFGYNFGVRAQVSREDDFEQVQDFQTLSAYGGVSIDKSNSVLDPTTGWRAEGRVVPTYAFGGSADGAFYARGVAQVRGYLPFGKNDKYVAAGRLRLGTVVGAESDDIPADSRFYAGGGGSVRGYAFQAIGPVDDDNETPLGGRSLLDGSAEFRMRYNAKIGLVGFIDAGNISDEQYPAFDNLRLGAGVGARYQTPAGPIRLDVAIPLNPTERDDDFQVYISIGQAF